MVCTVSGIVLKVTIAIDKLIAKAEHRVSIDKHRNETEEERGRKIGNFYAYCYKPTTNEGYWFENVRIRPNTSSVVYSMRFSLFLSVYCSLKTSLSLSLFLSLQFYRIWCDLSKKDITRGQSPTVCMCSVV